MMYITKTHYIFQEEKGDQFRRKFRDIFSLSLPLVGDMAGE